MRTDLLRTRRHQDAPAAAEALERRALLSSPGSFDTTFGDDGVVTRNLLTVDGVSIADAAFQADGKILLAGNAGGNLVLARFNADGSLDRSFGAGGGMVPFSLRYENSDVARRLAVQGDQKILVAGHDWDFFAVSRFNPDGTPDASFGDGGQARVSVISRDLSAVAIQGDGKILLGGTVWSVPQQDYDFAVFRFHADGRVDTSFDGDGVALTDFAGYDDAVTGLAVLPDGRILAAGKAEYASQYRSVAFAQYNPDGSRDATFGGGDGKAGGTSADLMYTADGGMVRLPDGRILLAGHGSQGAVAVARYHPDATPDETFRSTGPLVLPGQSRGVLAGQDNHVFDLSVAPDGTATVAGWTRRHFNDMYGHALLARFTRDGETDNAFSEDGYLTTSFPQQGWSRFTAALVRPDGGAVAAGFSEYSSDRPPLALHAYTAAGVADPAFGGGDGLVYESVPRGAADHATDVVLQPDGKTVIVGTTGYGDRLLDNAVLRFNADGTPDDTFGAGGVARPDSGPREDRWYAALLQPDGKLLLAGGNSTLGDSPRRLLARLNADGALDRGFGTNGFRDLGPGWLSELEALPDGKFLAAGRNAFFRFNPDGSPDTTFGTNGQVTVVLPGAPSYAAINDLEVLPDGRFYVLAHEHDFSRLPSPPAASLINISTPLLYRFRADGTLDPTFGSGGHAVAPGYYAPASSMAVDGDGCIVVAGYVLGPPPYPVATNYDAALARFLPNGTLDPSFGDGGKAVAELGSMDDWADDVAVQRDGKVIVGGHTRAFPLHNPTGDVAVARLNADGTPDRSFGDNGVTRLDFAGGADVLAALVLLPDGGILAAGSATMPPDVPIVRPSFDFALVRLHGDKPARVVGRHVFYNRSRFDNFDPAANASDDGAIATDKTAQLPGEAATFANHTSYSRGINGVIIDIADLAPGNELSAADFVFKAGAGDNGSEFTHAPPPLHVTVRRGAGTGGADRVTLVWHDGAIVNRWLQVTVLPNDRTGLATPDVFYFGNLVGDAFPGARAAVSAIDFVAVRHAVSARPVGVENRFDFNRDGRVTVTDVALVRRSLFKSLADLSAAPAPARETAGLPAEPMTAALLAE